MNQGNIGTPEQSGSVATPGGASPGQDAAIKVVAGAVSGAAIGFVLGGPVGGLAGAAVGVLAGVVREP